MRSPALVPVEERTARLTVLISPQKKAEFERLCAEEDLTSSQVLRRMIRAYIEMRLGRPWPPSDDSPIGCAGPVRRGVPKRRTART
jgi:hypothetical protein